MTGVPGLTNWANVTQAKVSALIKAKSPAKVTGPVAPVRTSLGQATGSPLRAISLKYSNILRRFFARYKFEI